MGANIVVDINGIPHTIGDVSQIATHFDGVDTLWVAQSDANVGEKYVDVNGLYLPVNDGLYGYSKVSVSCDQKAVSVSGKKHGSGGGAGDGKTYSVSTDEDGNLVEMDVPTEIRITTPPDMLIYEDKEHISFSGLVLTAYGSDGEIWTNEQYPDGIIPLSDKYLFFPVATARLDMGDTPVTEWATADLDTGGIKKPIPVAQSITGYAKWRHGSTEYECTCSARSSDALLWFMGTAGETYMPSLQMVSKTPNAATYLHRTRTGYMDVDTSATLYTSTSPTIVEGKTFYWGATQTGNFYIGPYDNSDISVVAPTFSLEFTRKDGDVSRAQENNARYIIMYGNRVMTGGQDIPVQWARPGDREILTAEFPITVVPQS